MTYQQFLDSIANLSQEKIDAVVDQARKLGYSEKDITNGLNLIKQIKFQKHSKILNSH